jgi:hypothetical protein
MELHGTWPRRQVLTELPLLWTPPSATLTCGSSDGTKRRVHSDPPSPEGLAWASLGQRHPEEAAEKALDAIRLRYDSPDAHQVLGMALDGLGWSLAAKQALATSQALRPRTPTA